MADLAQFDQDVLDAAARGEVDAQCLLLEQGVDVEQISQLVVAAVEKEHIDEPAGEEEEPADEEDEQPEADEPDVEEHLKDAIEGSLRLKRLLSRDEFPASKRQKTGGGVGVLKVKQLLTRWGLQLDPDSLHVVDGLEAEEIVALSESQYAPNKFNERKSCAEQIQNHALGLRERACPGSYAVDPVAAFKFKWKLSIEQDKKLRALSHKALRYVLETYDENTSLDDALAEAEVSEPVAESTFGAIPDSPGVKTIGRFQRLELVDPMADAVIFGDANLTFAMCLAKQRNALGCVGRVVATTFELLETLKERYKEIDQTIATLEELNTEVWHGVDCTRIAVDPKFKGVEGSFGAVYYNYPHAGAVSGFFDGHPLVNWRHENLMRLFFRALRFFMRPGGICKVASNANAVGVRYSYIIGGAVENEFVHLETFPFLEWCLHRYGRSYGDRRDTYKRPEDGQRYNAQRAEADMVYCFKFTPTDNPLTKQNIRRPPTLKTLLASNDGPFRGLPQGPGRERTANELYQRFVSECSGVHVG